MPFNVPLSARASFGIMHLNEVFNNDAISYDSNRADVNEWFLGAYPAEELPESEQTICMADVPFVFPRKDDGASNNFYLANQVVSFPPMKLVKLFFLCAGDFGDYSEEIEIHFLNGSKQIRILGFPDGFNSSPTLGASYGLRCSHSHHKGSDLNFPRSIWLQEVQVNSNIAVCGLAFGDNPFAHIFSITIQDQDLTN